MTKHQKGLSWFKWIVRITLIFSAIRFVFAFGHRDVPFQMTQVFFGLITGVGFFGGLAYFLGWLIGRDDVSSPAVVIHPSLAPGSQPTARQSAAPQDEYRAPARPASTIQNGATSSTEKADHYLDRAFAELSAGTYDKSLWFAATTATSGDLNAARHEYAKLRAAHLKAFDRALAEVGTDWYDKELWARAMVTANGDTNAARDEYARLRVDYWQSRSSAKVASPPRESSVAPATPLPTGTVSTEILPPALAQNFTVDEDAIYAAIANELKTGAINEGLWTRLFAYCDGDENRTKAAYIKQRAEKLIPLEQSRLADEKRQQDEQAALAERNRVERLSISEQLSSGTLSDDLREKLKELSSSCTAEIFVRRVRNNILSDVEGMLNDNPLLVAISNNDGDSPLHLAIKENFLNMSKLLLERGAPTAMKNRWGYTPLDVARATAKKSIVALLSTTN